MLPAILSGLLFFSLGDARKAITDGDDDYITRRLHASLACQAMAAFATEVTATWSSATLAVDSTRCPVAEPAQSGIQKPETQRTAR
jgi:hypothetical protein